MRQFEAEEFDALPGDDGRWSPEDGAHWIRVYQEVIEFCELMPRTPELSMEGGQLQRRLKHYRSRLEHWQQVRARALELSQGETS